MTHSHPDLIRRYPLALLLILVLALGGCMPVQPLPPTPPPATEDHSAHLAGATPGAGIQGDMDSAMATHEAQMADPAMQATHEAQMADPAAMATHEVLMHGTPTPAPEPAPAVANTVLANFNTEDFAGSGLCVMCHEGITDASGADVSITTHWRSTMMANAARDPAWQAKVASEVARNPELAEVIETKCATCHVPMAKTQAEVNGMPVSLSGGGLLDPAHPLGAAAGDGVSCTLCHQIEAANLGEKESFSGGYSIDTGSEPPERLAFGPYKAPFGRPMQMHTGYLPVFGKQVDSAGLCGSCHNLYTPYVDANGEVQGEFPEQTPYTEWEHSSFGAGDITCQACHMPVTETGVIISTMPRRLGPREPFYQHHFAGGNAFMVTMLGDHGNELGVTADAAHFESTAQRIDEQLGRAASLAVNDISRDDGFLTFVLQVSTGTGHKFPTSFPARRAWLHVTVSYEAGNVVFESGKPLADGSIAGNDADAAPDTFEPHYDIVTAGDQVQIYEPIMGDTDGKVTYTLLRASRYLKDNRLLPAGADKAALPPDVGVYGAAADDLNFAGGSDAVTYRVSLEGATGALTVAAELLYQPLSYRFVQDMLVDGGAAAERFGGFYEAADKAPARVATIEPMVVEE